MNFFTEEDPELTTDVSNDVSLDPEILISNLNKKFTNEKIEWSYDKITHRISIKSQKMHIFYKFLYLLEIYLVFMNQILPLPIQ